MFICSLIRLQNRTPSLTPVPVTRPVTEWFDGQDTGILFKKKKNNGNTGRKIYNIMPSVSLRPTNWIREDVIFFSQPFPAYLKMFHLSDSDYCSCGGIGTALHYATECIYTVSWHMRKPAPNFEPEWLKRVANNLVSRQKIRGIIKFMSENRNLFRPP
ncbi:hypothetical protein AVEN_24373-1 [Araneus ventricosus]|uniref:Uncharacterized protein n=1 Tax=Araneus ventricosus TaxID=182803 RepID=A0A4Y2HUN2_ARAVE|nr:hypothetical protein AVEN_24373-1 [Araneus ventricosus]